MLDLKSHVCTFDIILHMLLPPRPASMPSLTVFFVGTQQPDESPTGPNPRTQQALFPSLGAIISAVLAVLRIVTHSEGAGAILPRILVELGLVALHAAA